MSTMRSLLWRMYQVILLVYLVTAVVTQGYHGNRKLTAVQDYKDSFESNLEDSDLFADVTTETPDDGGLSTTDKIIIGVVVGVILFILICVVLPIVCFVCQLYTCFKCLCKCACCCCTTAADAV